ncbi:MAG: homoserine kinase [Bacteroidales bacterium]|nr:homoserine kinase [Bacteroidales bacterium]
MDEVKIFSPATVANVSCAFDILGFALEEVGDEMIFQKIPQKGVVIEMAGNSDLSTVPEENVAGVVALAMLKKVQPSFGVKMIIKKGIKPGSGIGSSAASASGAAFGVNKILGDVFSMKELVEFSMLGEALASGVRHADNTAPALYGGFTLVRSVDPLDVVTIPSPKNLFVSILHPQIEVKTLYARKILKKSVLLKDAVKQWGNIAGLISGLFKEDYALIGRSLQDIIVEPIRSILIPLFPEVKKAAVEAGALGSGISGSGPSMFALSEGKETAVRVAEAMKQVYAESGIDYEIHVSGINAEGVKVI